MPEEPVEKLKKYAQLKIADAAGKRLFEPEGEALADTYSQYVGKILNELPPPIVCLHDEYGNAIQLENKMDSIETEISGAWEIRAKITLNTQIQVTDLNEPLQNDSRFHEIIQSIKTHDEQHMDQIVSECVDEEVQDYLICAWVFYNTNKEREERAAEMGLHPSIYGLSEEAAKTLNSYALLVYYLLKTNNFDYREIFRRVKPSYATVKWFRQAIPEDKRKAYDSATFLLQTEQL